MKKKPDLVDMFDIFAAILKSNDPKLLNEANQALKKYYGIEPVNDSQKEKK